MYIHVYVCVYIYIYICIHTHSLHKHVIGTYILLQALEAGEHVGGELGGIPPIQREAHRGALGRLEVREAVEQAASTCASVVFR